MNARYALNALNARWGSLYDALYGTDAISEDDGAEITAQYNPVRGAKVIAYARQFLDNTIPLDQGSHRDVTAYIVADGKLAATLENGNTAHLKDNAALLGYRGQPDAPEAIVFVHNGLHFEIHIDPSDAIGKTDKAGVKDIVLESAITTIMDCEDSVAAVDAEDKTLCYRNWLGLITGDLTEDITKDGKTFTRRANPRSEEHTSELQSRGDLVCRLLLEKKKHRKPRFRPPFPGRRTPIAPRRLVHTLSVTGCTNLCDGTTPNPPPPGRPPPSH